MNIEKREHPAEEGGRGDPESDSGRLPDIREPGQRAVDGRDMVIPDHQGERGQLQQRARD